MPMHFLFSGVAVFENFHNPMAGGLGEDGMQVDDHDSLTCQPLHRMQVLWRSRLIRECVVLPPIWC